MRKQISPERKGLYYLGMALTVIGILTFVSAMFVTSGSPIRVGTATIAHWDGGFDRGNAMRNRALTGMGLLVLGQFLMSLGKRGVAGAGLILDPEKARRDVEPWARMGGGMIKDALDEAGVDLGKRPVTVTGISLDEQLRRLHKLHEEGILSAEEYQAKKKEILDRM